MDLGGDSKVLDKSGCSFKVYFTLSHRVLVDSTWVDNYFFWLVCQLDSTRASSLSLRNPEILEIPVKSGIQRDCLKSISHSL